MNPQELIQDCRQMLAETLKKSVWSTIGQSNDKTTPEGRRKLIGGYTAAVAAEFQAWLGATYAFARHETAQYALKDNIRCEIGNDHIGMLYDFAEQANSLPTKNDYEWVKDCMGDMRRLFEDTERLGLIGVTVLAVLESTSTLFIPVLAKAGKVNGVKDFTYTNAHGEADIAHSDAFIKAMEAEMSEGYRNPEELMSKAANMTMNLVLRIFANAA
ncbi:MAG: hypothetical protein V4664_01725 [Patescibacteria group bacterium]